MGNFKIFFLSTLFLVFSVFLLTGCVGEDTSEKTEYPSETLDLAGPTEEFERVQKEAEDFCNTFSMEECEQQQYISNSELYCTNDNPCNCDWGSWQRDDVCRTTLMWE